MVLIAVTSLQGRTSGLAGIFFMAMRPRRLNSGAFYPVASMQDLQP